MKRGKHTYRILKDARRQIARKAIILWGISAGLAAISPIAADTNSVYIHNLSANDTLTTAPVMPEFPGGIAAFLRFIDKRIKKPSPGGCCNSTTVVRIVIDKDGNVVNPRVIRSIDPMLDKEALRVIKLSPKWKPGELEDGTKVAVYYTVPVLFRPQ